MIIGELFARPVAKSSHKSWQKSIAPACRKYVRTAWHIADKPCGSGVCVCVCHIADKPCYSLFYTSCIFVRIRRDNRDYIVDNNRCSYEFWILPIPS